MLMSAAGLIMMMMMMTLVVMSSADTTHLEIDVNGYILYCPCMGRFGNQADHFLGSLAFAKGLNRTLVLPPWVEYSSRSPKSVPFDKYFKVAPLLAYHRVLTMERFMKELAPTIWPPGQRKVFCYRARNAVMSDSDGGCNAKDGNPFGPFWDTFNIDFDSSEFYSPLDYDTSRPVVARQWDKRYPPSSYPILAFTGAPAGFPVEESHTVLHRYLEWSVLIEGQVDQFLAKFLPQGGPFVGLHMRNGQDWVNVCVHAPDISKHRRHLFASAQCLGQSFEHAPDLTEDLANDLCLPSQETVLRQVKTAVDRISAAAVFVATDSDAMIEKLKQLLGDKVSVIQRIPPNPHVDLAILGRADHFIGNCVSTFSAFSVRERLFKRKSVEFWAFDRILPLHADEL